MAKDRTCPTCGFNPTDVQIMARTLDICKTALAILAHDPEFKLKGGIYLPGPVVLMSQGHNLIASIAQSPDGTIVIKAIDPVPTIATPNGTGPSH